MVKINGKEYAWGDIKIIMWGRPVVGATAIDYKPVSYTHLTLPTT